MAATGGRQGSAAGFPRKYVLARELADLLRVCPKTVRAWVKAGRLPAPIAPVGGGRGRRRGMAGGCGCRCAGWGCIFMPSEHHPATDRSRTQAPARPSPD